MTIPSYKNGKIVSFLTAFLDRALSLDMRLPPKLSSPPPPPPHLYAHRSHPQIIYT